VTVSGEANARFVEEARFDPVRFRASYEMKDVDDLLDRLAAAFRAGTPVADLVAEARFATTKFREGYAIDQVDRFLDEAVGRDAR